MRTFSNWRDELAFVVNLMRELSKQTDPQEAGHLYSKGVRQGLVPSDGWMTVSRRDLEKPWYRISRSTRWKEDINPWKQRDKLPLFDRGLLSELIYSEEPAIIENLEEVLRPDDPAFEYLEGFKLMVTMPQYDDGKSINMGVLLVKDPGWFPFERIPVMVWQSNLYGRGTLNLLLRQQLQQANDAMDRELRTVGEIQRSLLPTELPVIEGLDMHAFYRPSTRAGGDYYDLFKLADGKWGVFIADVSGHGTPAAVLMAITHALAHSLPGTILPPGGVLAHLNASLSKRYTAGTGNFVTAFYAVVDPKSLTMRYAVAGHNPPRLRTRGGAEVTALSGLPGLPLGIFEDEAYEETEITLAPGDSVLLYTDGITEAASHPTHEEFGTDRLDEVFADGADSAKEIVEGVVRAVTGFTNGRSPADDQTLLCIRVRRPEEK